MKDKFNVLVLDTECHFMSEHNKMVYDIGWIFGDIRNMTSAVKERRFIIKEFLSPKHWRHSYIDKETKQRKDWKWDLRGDDLVNLSHNPPKGVKVVFWNEMLEVLKTDIAMVEGVGSYNWQFDRGAIENTSLKLNHEPFLQKLDFKPFCILDMYVNKIINRDYFTYIDALESWERDLFKSKSGKNLGYSAEIMARYCARFYHYIEEHSSLMDSRVEFNLTRLFCDKHFNAFKTEFLNNPKSVSWTKIRDRLSSAEKMKKRTGNLLP